MLETIVEDEHLAMKVLKRPMGRRHSISVADHCGQAFQCLCEEQRFIAGFRRVRNDFFSIRNDDPSAGALAAITASEDADSLSGPRQVPRNPFDQRSLSRTARA